MKGSIPARQDANAKLYGPYLKWALKQWKTDKLAGSLTHGVVAPQRVDTDIDTALGLFLQTKDVAKFQTALVKPTAKKNGQRRADGRAQGEERFGRWGPGLLLVSPSIVLIAVFVYGLIGWNVKVSLSDWRDVRARRSDWAGLAAYRDLNADPAWSDGASHHLPRSSR